MSLEVPCCSSSVEPYPEPLYQQVDPSPSLVSCCSWLSSAPLSGEGHSSGESCFTQEVMLRGEQLTANDRGKRTTARSPCFKKDCLVVRFMPRASLDQAVAGTSQRPHPCSAPSPSFPVSLPPYRFLLKRTPLARAVIGIPGSALHLGKPLNWLYCCVTNYPNLAD